MMYIKRFKGFRGLGQGDGLHAADVSNLYCKDDALHKRNGFERIWQAPDAIDGLHRVHIAGEEYLLVYSDRKFYVRKKSDTSGAFVDITTSGGGYGVNTSLLKKRRTQVFEHDSKAYIVGCGDYLVLGLWGGELQLRRVEDNEDTYVPTTRTGIGCQDNVTYVPTTVDQNTVGEFYYVQDGEYAAVELDGDTQLPDPDLTYYRRIVYPTTGNALDEPNLLSTYRVNTLYGTPAGESLFTLDAGKVDSDSVTTIDIDVLQNQQAKHYTLVPSASGAETRAPVIGDDLGGVTLNFDSRFVTGVPLIRDQQSDEGLTIVSATGGRIAWHSTGSTFEDWLHGELVLYTSQGSTILATALRTGLLGHYTVSWRRTNVELPASFGIVTYIRIVTGGIPWSASLPTLTADLVCGQTVWGSIDYRTGTLRFTSPTTPVGLQDNITVRYKARIDGQDATLIGDGKTAAVFGVGGNADRLFVGACDAHPTTDYHSQSGDWSYFTPSSAFALGESGAIVGYLHRGQSLVTLLGGAASPNAYWRVGSWQTLDLGEAEIDYTPRTAVFAVSRVATLPQCATSHGMGSLGGDDVYLATDGLYRLYTTALGDDQKALLLSAPIDAISWNAEAVAAVYQQRYYVSDGRAVYVGDSRYRYTMHSAHNFEWFRWDIEGVTAFVAGDTLGFGTKDGSVCFFGDTYCDVWQTDTAAGQLGPQADSDLVYYDAALDIDEGDRITFLQEGYYHALVGYDVGAGRVYTDADAILSVYEGDQWYAVCAGVREGPYTVADVDWGSCSFVLLQDQTPVVFATPPDALLARLDGPSFYVVRKTDTTFGIATKKGGTSRTIYSATALGTARFTRFRPVLGFYRSEVLSLGSPDVAKLLGAISVGGAVGSGAGNVTFSVRTSSDRRQLPIMGLQTLSFDALRMDAFSFDGDFARAFRARCKLRFHYLQWQLSCEQEGDFTLDSVCLHYNYLHNAKGVQE